MSSIPWCIISDFNNSLFDEDKYGRVEHPSWLINGFRETVFACNIYNIQLEGYPFTWWRSKGSVSAVEERLDRAMTSPHWFSWFLNARLRNLSASIFDHLPILLSLADQSFRSRTWKFKFETLG